jgi:hypothetical protein
MQYEYPYANDENSQIDPFVQLAMNKEIERKIYNGRKME